MSSKPNNIAEQNLIFAGLGLQLGILSKDKVIRAFTEWLFDKSVPIGQILVQQKAITQDQRNALESTVKTHIQKEGGNEKALASLHMVKDLESDLDHLVDKDLMGTLAAAVTKRKDLGLDLQNTQSFGSESKDNDFSFEGPPSNAKDRFERQQFLDSGNLGEVYFAKDTELNRLVVAKYIRPDRADESLTKALFHLEGEVTGALEHPNIVPVYGLGKDLKGRLYYAMRYIRGRKFTKVIAEYHQIPKSQSSRRHEALIELLQYFQSACLAIEYAHSKGVLHCDIKPDNVMIGDYGEVFVVDWGLVVVHGNAKSSSSNLQKIHEMDPGVISLYKPSENASSGLHENQGGSRKGVGGTPAYMAPEQFKATMDEDISLVTAKADIYALGSTLYHLLTGRAPHLPKSESKESPDAFFFRITTGMIPKPKEIKPDVPNALQGVVLKAMNVNSKDRYGSARELAEDIKRWVADEPVSAYQENLREKSSRFARNNKALLAAASLALVFTNVVAFGYVTQGYNEKLQISEKAAVEEREKAQRSEQEANEQRAKAEKNESLAQQKLKEFADEETDRERIKKYAREKIDKDMVLIQAGSFMMGASQSEKPANPNETPHKVIISKPFMMGKFEVTKEQWSAVMNKNRLTNSADYSYPISGADWDDCQSFIEKLNNSTKEHYRLPTEAEWEYACRAGTTTKFSFGDRLDEKKAYYEASANDINKNHIPKPVGSYPPNPWGLYDMHGNVWEWCHDWYQEEYPKGPVVDPKGPENGKERVLRGGCFKDKEEKLSSSFRYKFTKTTVHNYGTTGFRLVKEIPKGKDQKSISQK